jgi:hypothetical protein
MTDRHALIAFLSTLLAILYLVTIAAWLAYSAKYAEALGIGGAVTGLIGIAGTFKPTARNAQDAANLATVIDKLPPQTVGTGPAVPAGEPA